MGGVAKALLVDATGTTFLARIAMTARAVGLVDGVVVVGPPYGERVAAAARELKLRVVENPSPERGMASSIALGFAAIAESIDSATPAALLRAPAEPGLAIASAAWLWPVDHPDVTEATLRALVAARGSHDVARPRHGGRGGHPPLVARELWPRLVGCSNLDGGARTVFAAADVVDIEVDDVGVVRDYDEVHP
jgi:CTP:molybdopterin cytidylyltransferase MocA